MYVLLFPSILFLLVVSVYLTFQGSTFIEDFFHGYFLYQLFAIDVILPVVTLVLASNLVEISIMLSKGVERSLIFRFLRSAFFLLSVFSISLVSLSVGVQFVFMKADPVRVATMSVMFTHWDHVLFGAYPWISWHSFFTGPCLQQFIYFSYSSLVSVLIIVLVVSFLHKTHILRKLVLSFCLVTFLGMPFWIALPSLSPDLMYRVNILGVSVQSDVKESLEGTSFSKITEDTLDTLEKFWSDPKKESLPVTSFPSMHAAWGVIVTVVGIELWAPSAFFLIPWLLAELVATVLTLEHYAVDTIFGALLGLLALCVASRLLSFDKKRFVDKWDLFLSIGQIQTDLEKAVDWLKAKIKYALKLT